MKVLYIDSVEPNYGSTFIYEGFCQLLGVGNITDYPENLMYHRKDKQVWEFQTLYPTTTLQDSYDLTILASPRQGSIDAIKEITQKGIGTVPLIFIDTEDYPEFNWEIYEEYNPVHCFKRSYMPFIEYPDNCSPLPLGSPFPITYVKKPRDIDIFMSWSTRNNPIRSHINQILKTYREITDTNIVTSTHGIPWNEYYEFMSRSKICIDAPGFGSAQAVRFWEGLSAGCCVFSYETPAILPRPFIHLKHFVSYNLDTLALKLQHVFYHKLDREIAKNGQNMLLEHYTVKKIAEYILEKTKIQ